MGVCASQPRDFEGSTCSPEGSFKSQSSGLQPCICQHTSASAPIVCLDAIELDDDSVGEILAKLPLQHLVQLSSCSRRLYRLVQLSGKVIKSADLQQLSPHQLEPALRFLQQHPAACAIQTAVLPSNCPSSATALAALSGLHQLTLFRASKVHFTEPKFCSLPLQQLQHITHLSISLVAGDVPLGQQLPLPCQLQRLQISATTFSLAINGLPLQRLKQLTSLSLSVTDSGSTKSLTKLLALTALQHLSLGRFWVVPDVLHSFSSLQSLEVYVYGKALKSPVGDLQMPLCASTCGLHNLPARPNLQLQVHVFVLSKCDGLADDWSNLINMRSLHLDNIYPCPGGFQLHALADLGRLVSLQLGFEAPHALVGHWQRLELLELYQLIHLKDLLVTCSGPWVELLVEAPKHLRSLLVACEGRLVLTAPGTAAAAAAAEQAAEVIRQYSGALRWSLEGQQISAPPALSPTASGGSSPVSCPPPASPGTTTAAPNQEMGGTAAMLLGGFGGWSGSSCPASADSDTPPAGSAAGLASSDGGGGGGAAADLSHDWPAPVVDDCSAVLQMQRRLDRLGSIGETEVVFNQEDEAEQLAHISQVGLLTGKGLHMLDPSLSRQDQPSTIFHGSRGSSFGHAGSVSGPGTPLGHHRISLRSGPRRVLSGTDSSRSAGEPVCLDTWLATKGLELDDMLLVQQQVARRASLSSFPLKRRRGSGHFLFRRRSAPDQHLPGKGRSSTGRSNRMGHSGGSPAFGFVVRQNMEEQLLNTFRQLGFAV